MASKKERKHGKSRVTVTRRVITTTTTTTRHSPFTHHGDTTATASPVVLIQIFLYLFIMVAFAILTSLTVVHHVHNVYLYPWSRAMVSNEETTKHEITYYDFQCDQSDITAFDPQPLLMDSSIGSNVTTSYAVDAVLRHGMSIFRGLIPSSKQQQVLDFRDYVLWRNSRLSNRDKINVLSYPFRYSFALHCNDHPSIPPLLQTITNNPLLQSTLERLLGPNPALVELSTITSEVGADGQSLHSDTGVHTSALKYSRSYVNIYSLLIPLQDTTPEMGATTVCPGSYRCNTLKTPLACKQHAFQVTTTASDKIWKTGDGLLYNSAAVHRGSAHMSGPDRVVLILSFASRPDHASRPSKFSRKLPFGATYAIRWDMMGQTWRDLQQAEPHHYWETALRGLGVWKPKDADWGWDSLSLMLAHSVNDRSGYQAKNLAVRLKYRAGFWGRVPWFLQGPISGKQYKGNPLPAFQGYVIGTLDSFWWFALVMNVVFVGVYVLVSKQDKTKAADDKKKRDGSVILGTALGQLAVGFMVVIVFGVGVVIHVARTPWGTDLRSGNIATSPFPNVLPSQTHGSIDFPPDHAASLASPRRNDILISTRLAVPQIAAFGSVLNHHPGNIRWHNSIQEWSEAYWLYTEEPWREGIMNAIIDNATQMLEFQFLEQNLLGDWVAMSREASRLLTEEELVASTYSFLKQPHFVHGGPCSLTWDTRLCRLENDSLMQLVSRLFARLTAKDSLSTLKTTPALARNVISFLPKLPRHSRGSSFFGRRNC